MLSQPVYTVKFHCFLLLLLLEISRFVDPTESLHRGKYTEVNNYKEEINSAEVVPVVNTEFV